MAFVFRLYCYLFITAIETVRNWLSAITMVSFFDDEFDYCLSCKSIASLMPNQSIPPFLLLMLFSRRYQLRNASATIRSYKLAHIESQNQVNVLRRGVCVNLRYKDQFPTEWTQWTLPQQPRFHFISKAKFNICYDIDQCYCQRRPKTNDFAFNSNEIH